MAIDPDVADGPSRPSNMVPIETRVLTAATSATFTFTAGAYRALYLDIRLSAKSGTVTETTGSLTGLSGTPATIGQVRAVASLGVPTNFVDGAAWNTNVTAAPSRIRINLEIAAGSYRGGRVVTWKNTATAIDVIEWMHSDTTSSVTAFVFTVVGGGNVTGVAELWGWP